MVLKATLNLARQYSAKTLTHGYAQSVVAASQSSYASQNTPFTTLNFSARYHGQHSPAHPSPFHHGHVTHPGLGHEGLGPKVADVNGHDASLAAYYAAWQKHQTSGSRELQQFQFAKRIGWKPPTTIPQGRVLESDATDALEAHVKDLPQRAPLARSTSVSALDDLKKEIIQSEKSYTPQPAEQEIFIASQEITEAPGLLSSSPEILAERSTRPGSFTSSFESSQSVPLSEETAATSLADADLVADRHLSHLESLILSQRYGEVPPTFQRMLAEGVTPSAPAYNALLEAAIQLPSRKHQVAPRALDVYADMLKRRVAPDTATYTALINLLAERASAVLAQKQALKVNRSRYSSLEEKGKFLLPSNEAEYAILAEDESLSIAVKLFDTAVAARFDRTFSSATYNTLITACAEQRRVPDMVRIYSQMEQAQVVPQGAMFAPMIKAFGQTGDLASAVECYNEYKALAVAHDNGQVQVDRRDDSVYAAVMAAYNRCQRPAGADSFMAKIEKGVPDAVSLTQFRDTVAIEAKIPALITRAAFDDALNLAKNEVSPDARAAALTSICIAASDKGLMSTAEDCLDALSTSPESILEPALSVIAMHLRRGDVNAALPAWKVASHSPATVSAVEPTVMIASALIDAEQAEHGLRLSREMFSKIRNGNFESAVAKIEANELIGEAVDVIARRLFAKSAMLAPADGLQLLHLLTENGAASSGVVERVFASLSPDAVMNLAWEDVALLLHIQADMIMTGTTTGPADESRFSHLLELVTASRVLLSDAAMDTVEKALARLDRASLLQRWQAYRFPVVDHLTTTRYGPAPPQTPVETAPSVIEDSIDPYAATTDNKGSIAINELLDKTNGRFSAHLNEALARFRNMRRAGRHPRFYTYAKLITAAARDSRLPLAMEVLAMAKQDVPLVAGSRIVHHGWVTILDSMVAACLNRGRRDLANEYHTELNNMKAAPSANTFGLYITTLKENTRTFDEASEAVRIFLRAKSEGVEPTSFLYNALIGKLGKARRIDDCLFYFGEMRALGIRPTSVTYGTVVNALCRVSDEKFAEEIFEEMESCANYKPRPAPYHSLMQYFLGTKRDRTKVLAYYDRMRAKGIEPTSHTYKLLVDTYATLEPLQMEKAEQVLADMRSSNFPPEAVHYSSLIHAKGCVAHDLPGARALFDSVITGPYANTVPAHPCLYQALAEALVANHQTPQTVELVADMRARRVEMTPYVANALIHGWTLEKNLTHAEEVWRLVPREKREPSTYEAMTRAYLAAGNREKADEVVAEALRRGYPSAVAAKISELVAGGGSRAA